MLKLKKSNSKNFCENIENEICGNSIVQLVNNLYINVNGKSYTLQQKEEESEFSEPELSMEIDDNKKIINDDPDLLIEVWKDSKRRSPVSRSPTKRSKISNEDTKMEKISSNGRSQDENAFSSCEIVSTEKPWASCPKFDKSNDNCSIYISGILLDKYSLESLLPTKYLEDNVIDAFGLVILNEAKYSNRLIFKTQHAVAIINEKYSDTDVLKWCRHVRARKYEILVFIVCNKEHWTLIIVIPKQS